MSDITDERLDATWRAISFELDAPRASVVERVLRAVRVPDHIARLVVATPALRRSWFLALAFIVLIGAIAVDDTDPRSSLFVFLFLAPLAPVVGVALAYGRWADPAHELHVTTPMHGMRLLIVRSITVLGVSTVCISGLAVLGDLTRPYAVAWLLPAVATTAATTAMMTFTAPTRAAIAVGATWSATALLSRLGTDDLTAFSPRAQIIALVLACGSAAVAWQRRNRLDVMRSSS